MPRYYFHLKSRVPSEDGTGIELPDVAAVRAEAMKFARELMKAYRGMDRDEASGDIVVTDDVGDEVMTILVPAATPVRQAAVAPGNPRSGNRSRARRRGTRPEPARKRSPRLGKSSG